MIKYSFLSFLVVISTTFAQAEAFRCVGTEPFWSYQLDEATAVAQFSLVASSKYMFKNVQLTSAKNDKSVRFLVSSKNNEDSSSAWITDTEVFFRKSGCNDGMSDSSYPYEIYLNINDKAYVGCCFTTERPRK